MMNYDECLFQFISEQSVFSSAYLKVNYYSLLWVWNLVSLRGLRRKYVFRLFKSRVLRKTVPGKKKKVKEGWRKLHMEASHILPLNQLLGLREGRPGFDCRQWNNFLSSTSSRPALMTTHLHLVPKSRKFGPIHTLTILLHGVLLS
jgi:hypothetical protein